MSILIHKKFKGLLFMFLPAFLLIACSSEKSSDLRPFKSLPFTKLSLDDMKAFQPSDAITWNVAGGVYFSRFDSSRVQKGEGHGVLFANNNSGTAAVLQTTFRHADMDLDLDFMTGKGSEASLWFQGRYKLSLKDSWKIAAPESADCGGSQVDGSDSLGRPLINACRAPGLWQHLVVSFKAARFDAAGKMVSPAIFTNVMLNGQTVLENFALPALSAGAMEKDEKARASLAFLSNKGAIAFRNIQYKTYDARNITLTNMRYDLYRELQGNYNSLKSFRPYKSGKTDTLSWRIGGKLSTIKITGTVNIITPGIYLFKLKGGGASAFVVEDEEVVNNQGRTVCDSVYSGSINLSEGKHSFSLLHVDYNECLVLEYEGPGIPVTRLTTSASDQFEGSPFAEELTVADTPQIQQGFIKHKGRMNNQSFTVGFANGINYSYDMAHYNLMGMWRGKYISSFSDGKYYHQRPLGAMVEVDGLPAMFNTDSAPETWPDSVSYESGGDYTLDSVNVPVYSYTYMGGEVKDRISANNEGLIRKITYTKTNGAAQSSFLLASGSVIEKLPDGSFSIDNKQYYVQFPDLESASHAVITKFKNGRYGLVWKIKADKNSETFSYALIW